MTIHYHGTPITPKNILQLLAGHHFCVSFSDPRDVKTCHQIGQSVMLDNGAFTFWTQGKEVDWNEYYKWVDPWLDYATTWAVIPDVIDGGTDLNDSLIAKWPFGKRGAPVWHLDEPLKRLCELAENWDKICFGSSGVFAKVGSNPWQGRIAQAFEELSKQFKRLPWIHMMRGMNQCGKIWPFASVDSTDIARNHHKSNAVAMAASWDTIQCPGKWIPYEQLKMTEVDEWRNY